MMPTQSDIICSLLRRFSLAFNTRPYATVFCYRDWRPRRQSLVPILRTVVAKSAPEW